MSEGQKVFCDQLLQTDEWIRTWYAESQTSSQEDVCVPCCELIVNWWVEKKSLCAQVQQSRWLYFQNSLRKNSAIQTQRSSGTWADQERPSEEQIFTQTNIVL